MKRLALLLMFCAIPSLAVQTPVLIQRFSGSNTLALGGAGTNNPSTYTAYFHYTFQAGDCVVIIVQAADNPNATSITVTDDGAAGGNTYALLQSEHDTTNGVYLNIYVALNVVAARTVTVSGNVATMGFVAVHGYEFNNIVTSSVSDGHTGHFTTGATLTAGSVTSTVAGDLVIMAASNTGGGVVTTFTAGTGQSNITWKKGTSDTWDTMASQWGVQTVAGALNAQMTWTVASGSNAYDAAVVFLKASSSTQGGIPPSNMQINGVLHYSCGSKSVDGLNGCSDAAGPKFDIPIYGNAVILKSEANSGHPTAVTDSHSNTWTCTTALTSSGNQVQNWCYSFGGTYTTDMTMTVTLSALNKDYTFMMFDINGAPTSGTFYDSGTQNSGSGNQTGSFATISSPAVTPTKANGIVIYNIGQDFNTTISSTNCTFISFRYNNEPISGPENVDENNGICILLNSNTSAVTPTWDYQSHALAIGNWLAVGAAFDPPVSSGAPHNQFPRLQ